MLPTDVPNAVALHTGVGPMMEKALCLDMVLHKPSHAHWAVIWWHEMVVQLLSSL